MAKTVKHILFMTGGTMSNYKVWGGGEDQLMNKSPN